MSEKKFEVAQIREIRREVGNFGGIMRILFVAERITPDSTDTIAMSAEFEWQKQDEISEEKLEETTRKLHTGVLQALLKEGWEPIGSDAQGRVMALRRELGAEEPAESDSEPEKQLAWQGTHPWRAEQ